LQTFGGKKVRAPAFLSRMTLTRRRKVRLTYRTGERVGTGGVKEKVYLGRKSQITARGEGLLDPLSTAEKIAV